MRIGPLFRLLDFFSGARDYAQLDADALQDTSENADRHRHYHRVIIVSGVAGLLMGLICGGIGAMAMYVTSTPEKRASDMSVILLSPIMFSAVGMLTGATWACAFAPTSFLHGPVGTRWVKLTGAKTPGAARAVALLFALLGTGFVIAMIYFVWIGKV